MLRLRYLAPMPVVTAEHRRHWDRVADLGCIITNQPAEVCHCHGGSMKYLGPEWQPGMGQRQNHWLVIPLSPRLHRGPRGLDTWSAGAAAWENYWDQTQIDLLVEVSRRLGYDVFERSGVAIP